MSHGIFITFEGGEGAGKSTQIRFVESYFRKKKRSVILVREPGSTSIGEEIRTILLNPKNKEMSVRTELFLYLAARAQLVYERILPALKKGYVVISDRFEDSTIVYQAFAGGLLLKEVQQAAKAARGNLVPDLTFLLDVSVKEGLKRSGREDRIEQKSFNFHQRIRKGYLTLAKQNKKRFVVISPEHSKEEVSQKIKAALDHAF